MDKRSSGWKCRAALGVSLVLGLAGCDGPVYTIHSIAAPSDEPSTVPDISGLWMLAESTWPSEVLRVTQLNYDVSECRDATVHSLDVTPLGDGQLADEVCFVPVAGHLILQLRTVGTVPLYRHYLVKFDQKSVSFCGGIWADLEDWSDEHPTGTEAHGLRFTRRGVGDSTELFVISPPSELLSYLEVRLPAVAKACDEVDENGDSNWLAYLRLTPPRKPDAGGSVEELASPRNTATQN